MNTSAWNLSVCPVALSQVVRKTKGFQISLTLEEAGNNQRNVVSPRYYFQELAVRNISGGLQVWSEPWATRVKNSKLRLDRLYLSNFCTFISSLFLSLPRPPYPSHISLHKLFPAFDILYEDKTQGSFSIPLGQGTSSFKTGLQES